MTSVNWSNGRGTNEPVRVHTVRAGEARLFLLLGGRDSIPTTYVHWSKELKASVPCTGEGRCPLHSSPLLFKAYAPVLMFRVKWEHGEAWTNQAIGALRNYSVAMWWRRVVEITQNSADIIDVGKPGTPFVLTRPSYRSNAPLELKLIDHPTLRIPPEFCFDARRVMERAFHDPQEAIEAQKASDNHAPLA